MPRWLALAGCALLCARPLGSFAASPEPAAALTPTALAAGRARAGPFLDLSLGRSLPVRADLRIVREADGDDYTIHSVGWRDESFAFPLWYAVRAGWRLRRPAWLALGLGFIHPKLYARTREVRRVAGTRGGAPVDTRRPVADLVPRFSLSHGENYLALEALCLRRFGVLEAHLGAGLGPVIAHAENEVEGLANRQRYEIAGLGWIGLAGVRFPWTRRLGLLAEYRFTRARLAVGIAGGEARLTERTHHLSAGVTLRR